MSDDLHRAVQAELDAHEPGPAPSFDAILDRKRARDRRCGVAALPATALAVAGVAFVPSALTGSGSAPRQVAQDAAAADRFSYLVKATDGRAFLADPAAQPALDRCLELPGLSDGTVLFSAPAQYTGTVTGRQQADALEECVDAVPGLGATLTPAPDRTEPTPCYVPGGPVAKCNDITPVDTTRYGFSVTLVRARSDAAEAALGRCLAAPGVETGALLTSLTPVQTGQVVGRAAADELQPCVERSSPEATFTLTPRAGEPAQAWTRSGPRSRQAAPPTSRSRARSRRR